MLISLYENVKFVHFDLFTWISINFRVPTSEFTGTLGTRHSEKRTRKFRLPSILERGISDITRRAIQCVQRSALYLDMFRMLRRTREHEVARWRNGYSVGLAISRSRVQIPLGATLRNNLGQVVHAYVPLSLSSITWCRPKGGDALRLGR